MAARRHLPCRICDLGRLRTFGVMATSLADLTNKGMEKLCLDKLGVKQTCTVVLEDDGTIIDDDDYLMHLPENTKFMILSSSEEWTPEMKFSPVVKTDSVDGVESVICVDYPESSHNWKILARQLRKNLALIITMSESDLQELIDVPTAELAEELEETLKGTESIQDSLQRALDNREEQRQAKGLLTLYQNACEKEDSEDAEETDQVDGPDATTSQTSQLSQHIVNTLRQKSSPELSLSNMELQSEMERISTVVMMKRAQNFTDDDLSTLLNEVEAKRKRIIGTETSKAPRKGQMTAWSEVADAVSANSSIARNAEQCRKKFNDLMRSAKSKMIHNAREPILAGSGVATLRELSEQEERVTQLLGFSSGALVPGSQSDIGIRKGGQLPSPGGQLPSPGGQLPSPGGQLPSHTPNEQHVEPAAAQDIGEGVTDAVGAVGEVKEEEIVKCLLVEGDSMDPGWLDTTSPSPGPSGSVPDTDDCGSTARNQPDTAEQVGDAAKRLTQQSSIETQVQQVEGLRQDMFTLHAKKRDSLASIRQGIDVVGKELTHVTMALNQMNETLVQLLQLHKAGSAAINLTPAGPPVPAPSADTVQAHEAAAPPIMMEANVAFQQQQPLCYEPTTEGQEMGHRGLSPGRRGVRSRGRGKRRRQ